MFSCVFGCNSLIINTIHFSGSLRVKLWLLKGMQAISGGFCSEVRFTMGVVAMVVVMFGELFSDIIIGVYGVNGA